MHLQGSPSAWNGTQAPTVLPILSPPFLSQHSNFEPRTRATVLRTIFCCTGHPSSVLVGEGLGLKISLHGTTSWDHFHRTLGFSSMVANNDTRYSLVTHPVGALTLVSKVGPSAVNSRPGHGNRERLHSHQIGPIIVRSSTGTGIKLWRAHYRFHGATAVCAPRHHK